MLITILSPGTTGTAPRSCASVAMRQVSSGTGRSCSARRSGGSSTDLALAKALPLYAQ